MVEKEQLPEKKKRVSCKRFFKYLGLVLLALMLTTSIIFQAPWKVITILAVILAGCTLLPKPARKWFWLSAGVVVIALLIWVFVPEDNEGWRPYTFDEETAAIEAKYAIPDEENAAFAYDEIIENLDIDSNEPEFFTHSTPSSKDGPWLSKDHPEMAEWLKGQQDTIEKLLQVSKKDKCIFLPIIDGHMVSSELVKRLSKIRMSAFLLVSAANNDIAEGRIDAALEKFFCINQMAEHMNQQPVMICHLVGIAIEHLGLQKLNRVVIEDQLNQEQLQLILNSKIDIGNHWSDDWRKTIDIEKLCIKNMLCFITYEINPEGQIRLSRNPLAGWRKRFPQHYPPPTSLQRKLSKAKTILSWLYYPSKPEKVAKAIDENFEKLYAMAEPDFDWSRVPDQPRKSWKCNYRSLIESFINMSMSSNHRIREQFLKNLALLRGSRLLVAIKQYSIEHGSWPANFNLIKSRVPAEAFIDPVSGNEFEYENHGKRFSLYGETINIWPK